MGVKLSQRSDIPPFRVMDILRTVNERTARGEDIIHLQVGQPSDGAPPAVIDYMIETMKRDPRQGYTEALGMTPLRERIAQWYKDYYQLDIPASRIAITVGASGGFILSFRSVFEIGAKVAIAVPGYPPYRGILQSLGLNLVEINTTAASNYQPTLEHLENLEEKIQGLIITSPSNPTGTVIDAEELRKIAAWCDANDVVLISDEIYHGITFGTKAETALRYSDNAIIVNSFSKYFAMTGWRLGWLVLPENVVPRVKSLSESLVVAPPTPGQHAAWKIFDHIDVLDSYVARYRTNLATLKRELPKCGFTKLSDTQGAFYLYADIHHLTNDSISYCRRILDEAKVACTPGIDFDPHNGHGTMRMSFAGSEAHIEEACYRLQRWMGG
jgi:aspartate/methionine/tyrosine aminotransferase